MRNKENILKCSLLDFLRVVLTDKYNRMLLIEFTPGTDNNAAQCRAL